MGALLLAVLLLVPATGKQDEMSCKLVATIAATSIAGGAFTTSIFPTAKTRGSWDAPRFAYLKVGVDLVDASNDVSNVRLSFVESETTAGTYRSTPFCVNAAPIFTCGAAKMDWNPKTDGKNWTLKPVDWGYLFGKITVTPTGHGTGDTVALEIYGCME